jgi:membrane complex biogenesis BtpA family protein
VTFTLPPRAVIGMVHLLPLPGSPRFGGHLAEVVQAAVRDAEILAQGGVHAVMVENFGDVPFLPGRVQSHTVACLTAVACALRARVDLPLGINVLRNDGVSAVAIALASGASFIRVNVLSGARLSDQGLLQGIAHELLRERSLLRAEHVAIWADVDVKHSAPLALRPLEAEVHDTLDRGLADALIVSGEGTGLATDLNKVRKVKTAARQAPVLVGSGVTVQSVRDCLEIADGVIVGTALKHEGQVMAPVDLQRVRALVQAARE